MPEDVGLGGGMCRRRCMLCCCFLTPSTLFVLNRTVPTVSYRSVPFRTVLVCVCVRVCVCLCCGVAQRIMEKIHKIGGNGEGGAEISREQFQRFASKHPALLFPAFQMQYALQKRIMGIKFWNAAAQKRNRHFGSAMNLQEFLREINELAFSQLVGHEADPEFEAAHLRAHELNPRTRGGRGSSSARRTVSHHNMSRGGGSSSSARYLAGGAAGGGGGGNQRTSRDMLPGAVKSARSRGMKKLGSAPALKHQVSARRLQGVGRTSSKRNVRR